MSSMSSSSVKALLSTPDSEEIQRLRVDLSFYQKRVAQLERELHQYKVLFGQEVEKARKRFPERAAKLGRVCRDIYDLILACPGLTTKEIQERWPEHKYHYKPTTWDNRLRDLRTPHPEWGWDRPLVVSIVEQDGLLHHYPNIQSEE